MMRIGGGLRPIPTPFSPLVVAVSPQAAHWLAWQLWPTKVGRLQHNTYKHCSAYQNPLSPYFHQS